MRYHLLAPTPISQWVSEWFIVSDLEIAIASPSFTSLFFGGPFLNWSSLSWSALGVGILRPCLTMWWQHQDNARIVSQIRNTKPAHLRFCIQYSVFVKLNQNSIKYWDGNAMWTTYNLKKDQIACSVEKRLIWYKKTLILWIVWKY